ncbi:hypothetical protein SapgrDRAFT_3389 [Saprospira grandis DSM 2844]|uniref:Uncharacterized protein n=1 Tax=Saprospira grandis DSM 2844 TaxID=694433 RepID=J0P564_9BACT|nr:phasin family protein [Saprospira grandis]EJF55029.1 hypothetical protein SapgrDRAFT_3389 [Saprospira grandis DSM 2844]
MNDLFKKAMQAGLGLAVVTTEKVKDIVDDLVEKGKQYQEEQDVMDQEAPAAPQEGESEVVEGEAVADEAQPGQAHNRLEELEGRLRKLVENAIERFNFIKGDEHERIEKRIERLEERLSELVKANTELAEECESSERV